MLFEQDRERISVNEVIRDRDVPLHKPYSCQSDELWARDGVSQKKENELNEGDVATETMDELRRENCDNVSSSAKITAIKMASEDEAVLSEPMNDETKVEETAIDCEGPRDIGSDRNRLIHHMGYRSKMGDCEEHVQSEMMTKETDPVEMDGDVLKVEHAEVLTYRHKNGDLYAEDVDQHMAMLPEVTECTTEITIDDIQVGDPGVPLTDDQEL